MKKNIKVILQSKIKQNNQVFNIKKVYEGIFFSKDNFYYIQYEDEEVGKTVLKINQSLDTLTCIWHNHSIKKMIFDEKKNTNMEYHLQNQKMIFNVKTTHLKYQLSQKNEINKIKLNYILYQENIVFGKYQLIYELVIK